MRLAMIAVPLVPAACGTMKSPGERTRGTATAEPLALEALRAGGAACPSGGAGGCGTHARETAFEGGVPRRSLATIRAVSNRLPPLELIFPESREQLCARIEPGERFMIGRGSESNICLTHESVSRDHAVVVYGPAGLTIEDLSSRHGTVVNGRQLVARRPVPLRAGDIVLLGPVPMRVDRVYELLRTSQADTGSEQLRTVMIEERRSGPDHLRTLRELMLTEPGDGAGVDGSLEERAVVAEKLLRRVLQDTGLERGLLLQDEAGLGGTGERAAVRVIVRVGSGDAPVSRTVLEAAREMGRVAHLSQEQRIRHAESIVGSGVTESICTRVPVRSGEMLYFYFDSQRKAGLVAEHVAQFVGVAAAVCALVLDSIEFRKLSEMRSQIERAAMVQRKLLPRSEGSAGAVAWSLKSVPAAPREEVDLGGNNVTGDLVGVARRPDGSTLAWIGDVSGHGISAAITMGAVQSWLHAVAGRVEPPHLTLAELNRYIAAHIGDGRFVSLLLLAIDENGAVEFCDAGHGQAFRIGASGPAALPMADDAGGMVVGAVEGSGYSSERLQLEVGERLVLVTDGLREARSSGGEEFGSSRVIEALRESSGASDDVKRLVEAVRRFSSAAGEDDLTILSLVRER
ncbi:MAG: hypothetical protein RL136_544 [Planctomycetota bacterium]|jgi:serine phosphatase RsbU (regulator of sigma subunit)